MKKSNYKPYKIVAAYDTETSNIISELSKRAYPILHTLGLLNCNIEEVTNANVESNTRVYMFRHSTELYQMLDRMVEASPSYVPVVCCHNLSFDMYSLAPWLSAQENVRVLAKSRQKPISFTICDGENNPKLVIWDTLIFTQQSLDYMGKTCGYSKLVGSWDYDKIRTPETPLTNAEIKYAKADIYTLLAYLGYWCKTNPDINPADLAQRVVSKTGVVRRRRYNRFNKLKGKSLKQTLGKYWMLNNQAQSMKSDDELFTCVAATRGGFTFVSRNNANRVFDLETNKKVYGYDATSQHPSQIVSHFYPVNFRAATVEQLTQSFKNISITSTKHVLNNYHKPFLSAFYGCFEFINLRLKNKSLFKKYGIAPLASARCSDKYASDSYIVEENEDGEAFKTYIAASGYHDEVKNPTFAFGKLEACDKCKLYLTELTAWEICQAYDFDSVQGLHGYITLKFARPSDMAVISVMNFYDAKNEFKQAISMWEDKKSIKNAKRLIKLKIPEFVVEGMQKQTIDEKTVKSTYQSLKADLNALFGVEACNEYRRDTILTDGGIDYIGDFGVVNAPKNNKAWYQFGARIVGWSRIAQILFMQLIEPHIDTIINGDTDSIKFVANVSKIDDINKSLLLMNSSIDNAKKIVCKRVFYQYRQHYSSLDEIGYYVCEFEVTQFCAAWNKAYAMREGNRCKFTVAGIPRGAIDKFADELIEVQGWTFGDVCDRFLGFNTTYTYSFTCLNSRSFPEWGSMFSETITDYLGNTTYVNEPAALALYAQNKIINDTRSVENRRNLFYALENRPSVNTNSVLIIKSWSGQNQIMDVEEMINGRA